jgi:hypothetical protein
VPSHLISSQDILRYIHRSTDDELYVPQLDADYTDIYKGEIVVNYSKDNPALYIRAGAGISESSTNDVLIRIGNIFVSDVEPLLSIDNVDKNGLAWYNTNNKHFYVSDGSQWIKLTNDIASESVVGLTRMASYAETIIGYENFAYVTPEQLRRWAEYQQYTPRIKKSAVVYVDGFSGDDSLENDGSDPTYPLLSIERAIIESLRRPINLVKVQPGSYIVDNKPGTAEIDSISNLVYRDDQGNLVGPLNPTGSWVVAESFIDGHKGTITVVNSLTQETLYRGQQLFFEKDGEIVGSAIIDTQDLVLSTLTIPVRYMRGQVAPGYTIRVARYSSFNAFNSGVIVPHGLNFVAEGMVTLIPRFITYYNFVEESKRSYLFKVAQNCRFSGFTFTDGVQKISHCMYNVITNATADDLQTSTLNYFQKISRGLGVDVAITTSTSVQTRLPWLQLDNCTLDSRYGSNLITLTGSFYTEMKDITIKDFVGIVTQEDSNMYEVATNDLLEEVNILRDGTENWIVRIDADNYRVMFNGGYTKYVPHFSIVDDNTNAIVNVGNHLILDDPHPPLSTEVSA